MLKIHSELPIIPHKISECYVGDEVGISEVRGKGKKLRLGKILIKFYKCQGGYLLSYDEKKVRLDGDMATNLKEIRK